MYLGFELFKRIFYKKTTLVALISLAFLIGYSVTIFIVEESKIGFSFTANEFILYFLGSFNISGVFLNIIYIILIIGIFSDKVNYMYISRLEYKNDLIKVFIAAMIFVSIFFLGVILLLIFIVAGFVGIYNTDWSEAVIFLSQNSPSIYLLTGACDVISGIIITIWLYLVGLFIIFMSFYFGFYRFNGISGGIFINIVLLSLGGIIYNTKSLLFAKLIPNINTIFSTHSLQRNGEYPSFIYSFFYVIIVFILMYILSNRETKRYLSNRL